MKRNQNHDPAGLAVPGEEIVSWAGSLREAMYNAISADDVTEIVASMVKKAKEGDMQAARFIADYVLGGKPNVNITRRHSTVEQRQTRTVEEPRSYDDVIDAAQQQLVRNGRTKRLPSK